MPPVSSWQPYLPIVVIAVVFLLRMRRINKPRRMRLGGLLVGPIIICLLAANLFFSAPPDATGLAIFAGGLAAGAAIGWQRARWMTVFYDSATGTFMLKQSPLALVLLIGVMLVRRMILPSTVSFGAGGHLGPGAMWVIDGLIGFGMGMVVAYNIELWRRARAARAEATSKIFS